MLNAGRERAVPIAVACGAAFALRWCWARQRLMRETKERRKQSERERELKEREEELLKDDCVEYLLTGQPDVVNGVRSPPPPETAKRLLSVISDCAKSNGTACSYSRHEPADSPKMAESTSTLYSLNSMKSVKSTANSDTSPGVLADSIEGLQLSGSRSCGFRPDLHLRPGTSYTTGETKYRTTTCGAYSSRVFPESQENIDKKLDQLSPLFSIAPLSKVKAVHIADVDRYTQYTVKYVHFLRHGEGTSNSAARLRGKEQYKSQEWLDARLTDLGKKQATDIAQYVAQSQLELDTVLVSPLRRATETGCIAFSSRAAVPFIALEDLRERAHGNPCDKRKSTSELQREFPAVDYSELSEADPFASLQGDSGESWLDTAKRANRFIDYLATRPETHLAAVTHSAFLLTLFNLVLHIGPSSGLGRWFETGELRTVALLFPTDDEDADYAEAKRKTPIMNGTRRKHH
ncbi:Phosphoglycerate mutase-like protein 1 [Diplonema papillatum]|nr:Phosphoglycerate mutase-like protein 1 [Diplonema papillatum]